MHDLDLDLKNGSRSNVYMLIIQSPYATFHLMEIIMFSICEIITYVPIESTYVNSYLMAIVMFSQYVTACEIITYEPQKAFDSNMTSKMEIKDVDDLDEN